MYEQFETGALHDVGGKHPHGSLNMPIYQTSTFVFDNAAQGSKRFAGEEAGYIYSRLANPTERLQEEKISAMEQAEDCVAFSSGMGAVSATLLTFLSQGDCVVADSVLYGCTFSLMSHVFPRFGISTRFVDCCDLEALKAAVAQGCRLVYFETPANPTMKIVDIMAVSEAVHEINPDCLVVVDNTFATPFLTRPLHLGVDIALHSATKYFSGHGDVIAGMAVGSQALMDQVRNVGRKDITGSVLSPHDAFLLLRGIKTLACRMQAHCEGAQQVANYLSRHDKVETVYFPGLPTHPGHAVAKKQMNRFGGMVAFEVKGGEPLAKRFVDSLKLCSLAVSLGDAETLVEHPASMTHAAYTKMEQEAAGISGGLVRLSVGLEHPEDIIEDLKQAFDLL